MADRRNPSAAPSRKPSSSLEPVPVRRYHHGNLRQALLESAEQILREQGVPGLKLRAIAKRAGVSHTAADPHFGDLTGLLSELAAIGYERLYIAMTGKMGGSPTPLEIGHGYIRFAVANPQLFALMFRDDALDRSRPRLQEAARNTYLALAAATASPVQPEGLSLEAGGRLTAAWALVHGLAMLLIDGRLSPVLRRIVPEPEPEALVDAALRSLSLG